MFNDNIKVSVIISITLIVGDWEKIIKLVTNLIIRFKIQALVNL